MKRPEDLFRVLAASPIDAQGNRVVTLSPEVFEEVMEALATLSRGEVPDLFRPDADAPPELDAERRAIGERRVVAHIGWAVGIGRYPTQDAAIEAVTEGRGTVGRTAEAIKKWIRAHRDEYEHARECGAFAAAHADAGTDLSNFSAEERHKLDWSRYLATWSVAELATSWRRLSIADHGNRTKSR